VVEKGGKTRRVQRIEEEMWGERKDKWAEATTSGLILSKDLRGGGKELKKNGPELTYHS